MIIRWSIWIANRDDWVVVVAVVVVVAAAAAAAAIIVDFWWCAVQSQRFISLWNCFWILAEGEGEKKKNY